MLFEFKPSEAIARRILEHLRRSIPKRFLGRLRNADIGEFRTGLGLMFTRHMGSLAQRVRYIEKQDEFQIIKDGMFTPEMFQETGDTLTILQGEIGDRIIDDIGKEFFEWVKQGDNATSLHPKAPIVRFVVTGNDVVAKVRPRDPPIRDPNFVRALRVE